MTHPTLFLKTHGVTLAVQFHFIACDQFAAPAFFGLVVHGDFAGLDQDFGLAARINGSGEFEKLVEFDVLCGDSLIQHGKTYLKLWGLEYGAGNVGPERRMRSNVLALSQILSNLDGQSYRAYRDIQGGHAWHGGQLFIDRVQPDPYAPPSACRVLIPQAIAQFPAELWSSRDREIALRDYLTRQVGQAIREYDRSRSLVMLQPGQAILERSCLWIDAAQVELRLRVSLPAVGRRIAGKQAAQLLGEDLAQVVARSLHYTALDAADLARHIAVAEDAAALRSQLVAHNLIAFVADGAMLARSSGVDDWPDPQAIPFESPAALRVTLPTPNQGAVTGMGIGPGITLIVGGGYHGKSTLLRAIERGIYNHIPGDGREGVVTLPTAVKIRAEDGRMVHPTDLSALINHLPLGRSSTAFTTENASGSTSQAANIVEAVAAGAQLLLMDEDTCATNLMIRDARMQRLIAAAQEPITPLIDKVRPLYDQHGVSTIMVMGGCGDYLAVADRVIAMQDFRPRDVTAQAQAIVAELPNARLAEGGATFGPISDRLISTALLTPKNPTKPHRGRVQGDVIRFAQQEVDLGAIAELIEPGQWKTLAAAIVAIDQGWFNAEFPTDPVALSQVLAVVGQLLQSVGGLDRLTEGRSGDLVQVRSVELAAALNRLRHTSDHR
jgi:predicted ABC-class ATPase